MSDGKVLFNTGGSFPELFTINGRTWKQTNHSARCVQTTFVAIPWEYLVVVYFQLSISNSPLCTIFLSGVVIPAPCSTSILFILNRVKESNCIIDYCHLYSYSILRSFCFTFSPLKPFSSISVKLNALLMLMEQRDTLPGNCDAAELLGGII